MNLYKKQYFESSYPVLANGHPGRLGVIDDKIVFVASNGDNYVYPLNYGSRIGIVKLNFTKTKLSFTVTDDDVEIIFDTKTKHFIELIKHIGFYNTKEYPLFLKREKPNKYEGIHIKKAYCTYYKPREFYIPNPITMEEKSSRPMLVK